VVRWGDCSSTSWLLTLATAIMVVSWSAGNHAAVPALPLRLGSGGPRDTGTVGSPASVALCRVGVWSFGRKAEPLYGPLSHTWRWASTGEAMSDRPVRQRRRPRVPCTFLEVLLCGVSPLRHVAGGDGAAVVVRSSAVGFGHYR
jgi:hypothetical protein